MVGSRPPDYRLGAVVSPVPMGSHTCSAIRRQQRHSGTPLPLSSGWTPADRSAWQPTSPSRGPQPRRPGPTVRRTTSRVHRDRGGPAVEPPTQNARVPEVSAGSARHCRSGRRAAVRVLRRKCARPRASPAPSGAAGSTKRWLRRRLPTRDSSQVVRIGHLIQDHHTRV